MLTLVNVGVDQARFPNRGFKGGVISEVVFNLVQSQKNDPNQNDKAFLPKVKRSDNFRMTFGCLHLNKKTNKNISVLLP